MLVVKRVLAAWSPELLQVVPRYGSVQRFHLQELCRVLRRVVEGGVALPSQASLQLLVPVHLHLNPNLQPHNPHQPLPNNSLQLLPPPSPPSPAHHSCPAPSPRKHQHCLPPVPSVCNFLPSCTGGSSCGGDSLDAERPPQMGGSRYTARRHTTHPLHTPTPRLGRATML